MERRSIHAQGPVCSRIIAGAWRWHTVSPEQLEKLVHTALDQGITSFDHADIYGDHTNEERFGNLLRSNPSLRNRMELITKCGIRFPSSRRPDVRVKHYDTSARHILGSVDQSLKMLGTDRLDLLLIHRPDPLTDPAEVAEAFTQVRKEGKVLHVGVSNFTTSQFRMLQSYLPFPLVTNQIEISWSHLDSLFNGDLDLLMELRVSPMAWSPLGGGKPMNLEERELFPLAARYNATYSQLALAWLLRHPSGIFPIIGSTSPDRIEEAARSMAIAMDRQDWFEILKGIMRREMP
jgi:predicted oxidoreductase